MRHGPPQPSTLSLVSLAETGLGAAVLAVGSAAGAGAFLREYANGRIQLLSLKDDPVYLLWRLSKVRS